MTTTLPPDLIPLRDAIIALSRERRELLLQLVGEDACDDKPLIAPQVKEELLRRMQAADSGESMGLPMEDAFQQSLSRLEQRSLTRRP